MNQELDEATAVALAVIVRNHIEALRVWERKMRIPYMPTVSLHLREVPKYPKPTLSSALHLAKSSENFQKEVVKLASTLMKVRLQEKGDEP